MIFLDKVDDFQFSAISLCVPFVIARITSKNSETPRKPTSLLFHHFVDFSDSKKIHADITISATNISTTSEHDSNLHLNSIIKIVHIHYIFSIIPFRKERYGR